MVFTIPAPLHSYHETRTTTGWNKAARKRTHFRSDAYKESQVAIRLLANVAQVPDVIGPREYARIQVTIYWKNGVRLDAPNVYKWLEDALFKQDQRVFDIEIKVYEHQGPERADVRVDIWPSSA